MSKVSSLSVLFKWNKVKSTSTKTLPRSRCKHACCLHNEYAYIIGGKDGNVSLKDFCRFHLGSQTWEELSYRGEKIPHFEGHTLVAYKRLLLLFGGVLSYDHTESALWIINPDLQYIRRQVPDTGTTQPCARRHHTSVIYNDVMYIYGGYIDLQGSTNEIWAYHIDDEEWEQIKPNQRLDNTAGSRHGHSAVLYGRDMWVYGGMSGLHSKADLWKFNFHSLKWDRIKTKFGPPTISGHTATVVKDYMVVIGGDNNGTLSADIWVFGLCTLKWTHYQPTHQYPDPCKWHTVIPVTAKFKKGDQSVRTTSLPYLKNKLRKNHKRPKSSPIYSSARYSKKSSEHTQPVSINRPNTLALSEETTSPDRNNSNASTKPIEMKTFSENNVDRRSPYKGNGFTEFETKPTEEKSPLLCNRQTSKDSVLSTGSGLGTDNPCLELDGSMEKVNQFQNCNHGNQKFSVSFELTDLTPFDKHASSCGNTQVVTRFVKNDCPTVHTSAIPGQVNMSPNKDDIYSRKKFSHSDLTIEDLEFCDNYFSDNGKLINQSKSPGQYLSGRKHTSDLDIPIAESTFNDTAFIGHLTLPYGTSLDGKSLSLSDISQPHSSNDSSMYRSASTHNMMCRKCSLNCWVEETDDSSVEDVTHVDVDNKFSPKHTDTGHRIQEGWNGSKILNQSKPVHENKREPVPTVSENGPPYLLLFGGFHEKGEHNISVESLPMWQCDVVVRHSDISHGEYHKSSLVI